MNTESLFKIIERSDDISSEWDKISGDFSEPDLSDYFDRLFESRGFDCSELARRALISRSFAYQIVSGVRAPGRDILIRIAIAAELDIDETQALLRLAGRGALYPKKKRDAFIISCIVKKLSLTDADSYLRKNGLEPLI